MATSTRARISSLELQTYLTQQTTSGGGSLGPLGHTRTLMAQTSRRRRRALMSTHDLTKVAGTAINYNVIVDVDARDNDANPVPWPYFVTVALGTDSNGIFTPVQTMRGTQLELIPGRWRIVSGKSDGLDPLTTPDVPNGRWDVRAILQAAESDSKGSPTLNRLLLDEARHPEAIRSLSSIPPPDSGSINVPGASARVRVGVFRPIIPQTHPDPFNAPWTETRRELAAAFPAGFWSYRIQLRLAGKIRNKRPITVQFFFRDIDGNTTANPTQIDIPTPASQGFDWWDWYEVAAWVSNLAPRRYQVTVIVFEPGSQYGRRTVWFDMI